MALFFIEAVRFDGSGQRVAKVRWGKSKGGQVMPPAMVDDPQEADVQTVLDTIANGDEVLPKFHGENGIILGPKVVGIHYEDGASGLSTASDDTPGHSLNDLPSF
ncbi:hypothetical protein ACO0LL_21130 [Undibacterium sp. TC4M20W]|uniref:hypothetical protein n=1 Tax=unclassified Undibacterium TaxID=2630295 RepID=UPI003BEFF9F6